jgi:hypothetical protein
MNSIRHEFPFDQIEVRAEAGVATLACFADRCTRCDKRKYPKIPDRIIRQVELTIA